MVTALYLPESSNIIQKHVEDFAGFGMVRVKERGKPDVPTSHDQIVARF